MSLPLCGVGYSFTAKVAEDAKENKSFNAKDTKAAKDEIQDSQAARFYVTF